MREHDYEIAARLTAAGRRPSYILSALGHPGYGQEFAARVLTRIAKRNTSTHLAIANELSLMKGGPA